MGSPATEKLTRDMRDCGVFLKNDHFVLKSGRHSRDYVDGDSITSDALLLYEVAYSLVRRIHADIEVLVGVSMGGIPIATTMMHLQRRKCVFTEKNSDGSIILSPTFKKKVKGKKIAIIDDVLSRGTAVRETKDAVISAGGSVQQIAVAIVREPEIIKDGMFDGIPFTYLLKHVVPSWPENECPACAERIPVNTEYGHGAEFERQRA